MRHQGHRTVYEYWIACDICGARGPSYDKPEKAEKHAKPDGYHPVRDRHICGECATIALWDKPPRAERDR